MPSLNQETVAERQPSAFLTLAPATSSSYPQMPASRAGNNGTTAATAPSSRRSSSGSGYRVLKLGPVHWGEHLDDDKEDYYYEAAASP